MTTLPKMAKAAQSKDLRNAFTLHERETRGQVKRLDRVFKIIGKPRGKTCAAINGITEEGSEIMREFKGMPALDAGLLAAAQAVEHYEISRYDSELDDQTRRKSQMIEEGGCRVYGGPMLTHFLTHFYCLADIGVRVAEVR